MSFLHPLHPVLVFTPRRSILSDDDKGDHLLLRSCISPSVLHEDDDQVDDEDPLQFITYFDSDYSSQKEMKEESDKPRPAVSHVTVSVSQVKCDISV